MLTIEPPPRRSSRMPYLQPRNVPSRLIAMTRRQVAKSVSSTVPMATMPAALTRPSSRPPFCSMAPITRAQSASTVTSSAWMTLARPGRSVVTATPPCAAIEPAIADPIAPAAPVTSTTLSLSRCIASRRLLFRHDGDGFDLEQVFRRRELADLHGGRGRRCLGVEVTVAHFAEDRDLPDVDEVVGGLDDVLETGAGRGQSRLEIFEALGGLAAKVAGDFSVRRHADLAGDIDGASRARRFHDVGVAARGMDGRWILKTMNGHARLLLPASPAHGRADYRSPHNTSGKTSWQSAPHESRFCAAHSFRPRSDVGVACGACGHLRLHHRRPLQSRRSGADRRDGPRLHRRARSGRGDQGHRLEYDRATRRHDDS